MCFSNKNLFLEKDCNLFWAIGLKKEDKQINS